MRTSGVIRFIDIAALFAIVAMILPHFAGGVEGRFFPVANNAAISNMEPLPGGSTRMWGTFEKHRDCAFVRLEWWIGDPKTGARVPVIFEERAKDRSEGVAEFGPWSLRMSPHEILNSTAFVVHSCHPFWDTVTLFHSPETSPEIVP